MKLKFRPLVRKWRGRAGRSITTCWISLFVNFFSFSNTKTFLQNVYHKKRVFVHFEHDAIQNYIFSICNFYSLQFRLNDFFQFFQNSNSLFLQNCQWKAIVNTHFYVKFHLSFVMLFGANKKITPKNIYSGRTMRFDATKKNAEQNSFQT